MTNLENRDGEIHVSDVEASGATKEGVGRWILLIGTLLAILLLSVVWIVPALMESDVNNQTDVSGQIREAREERAGEDTDSIIEPDRTEAQPIENEARQEDGVNVVEN